MTRRCPGPQRDGWASAQAPRLVTGKQLPDQLLAPAQRQREADRLRAEVQAHIAAGGAYEVVDVQATSGRERA